MIMMRLIIQPKVYLTQNLKPGKSHHDERTSIQIEMSQITQTPPDTTVSWQ